MVATKPTRYPDWATEDEISPAGSPNKIPVPDEFKLSGLKAGEPMPRPYFNDQHNLLGQWVRYFEETLDNLAIDAGTLILQQIYDVGDYWITESEEDPAVKFGFGTWVRVEGKFLIGRSTTDTEFDGVGEEGGSKTHNHSHTLSVPSHNHTVSRDGWGSQQTGGKFPEPSVAGRLVTGSGQTEINEELESLAHASNDRTTSSTTVSLSGSIQSSSNLPPFRAVNIWRRTA